MVGPILQIKEKLVNVFVENYRKSEESLPKILIYKNVDSDHKILLPEM